MSNSISIPLHPVQLNPESFPPLPQPKPYSKSSKLLFAASPNGLNTVSQKPLPVTFPSTSTFSFRVPETEISVPMQTDALEPSHPRVFKFSLKKNNPLTSSAYSVQPRGKKRRRPEPEITASKLTKVSQYLNRISEDFTLGESLKLVFWYGANVKETDLRQPSHRMAVSLFLQGRTSVHPVTVLQKMYPHPSSYPSYQCSDSSKKQRSLAFSLNVEPTSIKFAKPAFSSWAAQLCVTRAHQDLTRLTRNDTSHPDNVPAQISLSRVTWGDINTFTPEHSVATIRRRAPYLYHLLKYLAEPRKAGQPVPWKNRPTDIQILTAFNAIIVRHNRYVNGYLSLPLGVQLFSSQAHSDIKCFLCRMGLSMSDASIRKALDFMTTSDREEMQQSVVEAAANGDCDKSFVFDNVQEHCSVYEGGVCRTSEMKVGTAGTAIKNEDCPRSSITVDSLLETINWANHHNTQALYVVKTLINDIASLSKSYSKAISDRFRAPPLAIHRIPDDRRTQIQPLGTNSEREIEIHGMKSCIEDFVGQTGFAAVGVDEEVLEWVSGDGATFQTCQNLQKYLAPTALGNRETLRNKIVTPELWHTKDKALKAILETHAGPATSSDPSSLSKLYALAGFKCPPNPKECNHYPTVRALETIWIAQILDCWRVEFGVDDLSAHFDVMDTLPSLDELVRKASVIVQKYTSVGGYENVLSASLQAELKEEDLKVKLEPNSFMKNEKEKQRTTSKNNKSECISMTNDASVRSGEDADMESDNSNYDSSDGDESETSSDSDEENEEESLELGVIISEKTQLETGNEEVEGSDDESEVDVEGTAVIPESDTEWSGSGESDVD
ncbi:hypothetical protein V5O48_015922 [Marasmius crinis-equi]|uniref:DUF6589 domain-containing protein n=1 Tax=Marasmius crinis-equi TaxID=585013 RepID=A0ABR3ET81_9AGAR